MSGISDARTRATESVTTTGAHMNELRSVFGETSWLPGLCFLNARLTACVHAELSSGRSSELLGEKRYASPPPGSIARKLVYALSTSSSSDGSFEQNGP